MGKCEWIEHAAAVHYPQCSIHDQDIIFGGSKPFNIVSVTSGPRITRFDLGHGSHDGNSGTLVFFDHGYAESATTSWQEVLLLLSLLLLVMVAVLVVLLL